MKILKQKKKLIRRKSPLPGMTKEARQIWTAIFKEYPPRHFSPAVYDLLRGHCEQIAIRNSVLRQLSAMGPVLENEVTGGSQKNPLFKTARKYEKMIYEYHYDLLSLKPELLDKFYKPSFEIVKKNE